tara:strand:+ start:362 stop:898 length:537 start_codon:yes stop_codon:yes gene_type:complete
MDKEDIFKKAETEETVVKKPRRKLTEKQLANLAKGRERMKLKREEAKKNKDVLQVEKKKKKEVIQGEKEHIKLTKENLKKKRKTIKEISQKKEMAILEKLQQKEKKENKKKQSLEDLFHKLKVDCLSQAKSVREYTDIKESLEGIDGDILMDDTKLKDYVSKAMSPFINGSIVEEQEE